MELQYWIRRGGKVRGPYSADKLVAASKAGKTHDGDAVATSESGPWHDLGRWLQKRDRPLTVAKVRYHKKPFGLSLLGVGATVSYQCPKCAADLLSDAASLGSGETCEKCRVHFTFSSEAQSIVEEEVQKVEQLAVARQADQQARRKKREEQQVIQQAAARRAAAEKKDRDAAAAADAKRKREAITPEHKKLRKMRFAAGFYPVLGLLLMVLGLIVQRHETVGQLALREAIASGNVELAGELSVKYHGDGQLIAWVLYGFSGFCFLGGVAYNTAAKTLASQIDSESST